MLWEFPRCSCSSDARTLKHFRICNSAERLPELSDALSEDDIEIMRRLLHSGISRNRNKAIKMGTDAASAKGGVAASTLAGAAIGSILLPGIGTAVGAALGGLLDLKRQGSTTIKK